jgi:TonB family protein
MGVTAIFHVALLLILFFSILTTPDPPMGGGEGMIVNLGYMETGSGDVQPLSEEMIEEVPAPEKPSPVSPSENFVTQEDEETENVETSKEESKETVKETITQKETSKEKDNNKEETPKPPKVNSAALYTGKKNNATSQGNDPGGKGDKGNPDGDPKSMYYGKSGNGNGPGNGGGGSGNGTGDGKGDGKGTGFSYDLKGRKILQKSVPTDNSNETGTVVVSITVDKNGKVVKATPGARGSNTTNASLYKKAEKAAYLAKFDPMPEGPEEQRGSITFIFKVN